MGFLKPIGVLLIFASMGLQAQTPAMVNWSCMVPDSMHVSSVGGSIHGFDQSSSPGFVVRDYNNGPGPNQRWWPFVDGAAVPWGGESAQVDSRYVQFSVSPNTGFNFITDSIKIRLGAKGTSNMRANVVIALDPDFNENFALNTSPIELIADSDQLYSWGFPVAVADGATFYVRIYPWYQGASSTSKYLYVRDATISGSTQGLTYPASATWDLTNPAQGGTGANVALTGPLDGSTQDLHGLTVMGYSGVGQSQLLDITGGQWPANQILPIDFVYSSFRITAQVGNQFTAAQISLKLSSKGTVKMRAVLKYSSEPNFANSESILYTTSDPSGNNYLIQDSLQTITSDVNRVIAPGKSLELRVYPWVDNESMAVSTAQLSIQSVQITGQVEIVPILDPPNVSTSQVSYISTTHAQSGGNVTSDGGAPLLERGVCWNTTGSPIHTEAHTSDGNESGVFTSDVTDLQPETGYYLRAYAINEAGVAYGDEVNFTTLAAITPPRVGTHNISNILVHTAECGGSVYDWGGAGVLMRGLCWNTTGNPTLEDAFTEDGSGTGTYYSLITNLSSETTYYVRAYATNSAGTAYGNEVRFTTQAPAPAVHKTVAQDGTGDYLTVQEAFDAVPDYYTGPYTISVKAGTYYEKLVLEQAKINVILRGESAESTILTYDDYAGIAGGTSMSYSVAIDADDFTAMDITFQNTVVNDGTVGDQQGVALRVNGDRQAYYNCRLMGYQDTYYTWGGRGTGRIYMKDCFIQGSVDFIFGRDIVVFDTCHININRNGGSLTAASTEIESRFGYVFLDCDLTADEVGFDGNPISSFLLGRPWQAAPRTVFLRCNEPASLDPAGWSPWNVEPGLYAEYMCTGPGASVADRHAISRQLTAEEAADYTIENIFSRQSHPQLAYSWLPVPRDLVDIDLPNHLVPRTFSLRQNFPNPFNPSTVISYSIPESGFVELLVYDMKGQLVKTLVRSKIPAGSYEVELKGDDLSCGVYLYQLRTGSYVNTRKMIYLK